MPGDTAGPGRSATRLLVPARARQWASPRLQPNRAFVDLDHDEARTIFVAGSQRSGTTWLASLLVEAYRCRLVFEPLRADHLPAAKSCPFNRFLDVNDADADLEQYVRAALSGRVRSAWSDRWNTVRIARRRVVKEIGQNLLVPWIARRLPRTPVVLVLRHPLTSAASAAELGWRDRLDDTLGQPALRRGPLAPFESVIDEHARSSDAVIRHVLRWSVETLVPTSGLDRSRALVVFFEDLSADPQAQLDRVHRYLQGFPGRWQAKQLGETTLRRPSFTDWRGAAATSAQHRFDGLIGELGERAVEAMALASAFGLDHIYGMSPRPTLAPEEVLTTPPGGSAGQPGPQIG